MRTTPRRVFLSYAQEDGQRFARDLSARLSEAGHLPWRDQEQLSAQGGVRWVRELTRQLLTSDVIVVVLTPGACDSQYVEAEWMKALEHGLPVVPALFLDSGVPLPLTPLQHIDFRSDPSAAFAALLDRLALSDRAGAVTERDRQTLEALRALQADATGARKAELDSLIRDLAERIDKHPENVRAQTDRVERGLAEEKQRAVNEAARPSGPGVRRYGRRPPTALDAFRDREQQQAEIVAALFDPKVRMVSVLGRGGMGKTALACYVLAALEAGKHQAATAPPLQGVAYVQHTPTQPITLDRLLLYIARVLPDEAGAKAERVFGNRDLSTEDRVDRFLDLLADTLVIVLLDNFEDLLDERGRVRDADLNYFVRRVLAGEGALRLLVTARAAINLPAAELRTERQVNVKDGLPDEDALAVLKELDPNQQLGLGDARDEELMKLVRLTHGIPRALELVANVLKGDDDSSFLLGIDDVAHDFYTRETVVQTLVEVNYAKLRPEARRVVEALAVLGRPVPPVAIDFLLQPHVPGLRLREVLQPLVNARLVSVERGHDGQPGTLALHPIDRDFLYQRLPDDGVYSRTSLHTRAAEYYRTQRTHGPRGWRDIAQLLPQLLEYEHLVRAGAYDQAANLLGEYAGAIAHCGQPTYCRDLFLKLPDRFTTDAARISHGLAALVWKAYLGPVADGLAIGEQTLQLAVAAGEVRLELQLRSELVVAYRYAHDSQRSTLHAERIAERIAETGEPLKSALAAEHKTAFDLVLAYVYDGDVRRAAPLAQQAYDMAVRSGEAMDMATALNALIVLHFATGRYDEAVRVGLEIERLWRPGFNDGIAYTKNLAGMAYYLLGEYPAAVSKLTDARTTADEWDSPRPEALSLWNLSLIHTLHGVYDKGLECGREAEALMTRFGLGRAAHAPQTAAAAAMRDDYTGLARALLDAADEWSTCGDLLPGPFLAARAEDIARRHGLPDLAAEARAVHERLSARLQLPEAVG
jgi:hypothetical protein